LSFYGHNMGNSARIWLKSSSGRTPLTGGQIDS
jgi:hypothetical protein